MRGVRPTRIRLLVGRPWNQSIILITSLICRGHSRDVTSPICHWERLLTPLKALEMFSAHNVRVFLFNWNLVDKNSSSNLIRVGSSVVLESIQEMTSRRHKKMSSQNLSMSSKEPSRSKAGGTSTFNNPARKTSLFGNMKRK